MTIIYNNRRRRIKRGRGLVNKLINRLPIELHLPGYNFCGPGTKLAKRLSRGDKGVNLLDEACKEHDITYSQSSDLNKRHIADRILAEKAWQRYQSKESSFGEKAAALGVTGAMKAKLKLGMGCGGGKRRRRRRRQRKSKIGKGISFQSALRQARKGRKSNKRDVKKIFKKVSKLPRVIPIPKKSGGFLPLLFAGLSALGALAGGGSAIATAVNKAKMAQKNLEEAKRHNKKMESITVGKGMYLEPYKKGLGLYLNPWSKN